MNKIGIDIVDVERILKVYNKFGEKFLKKIFNESEIEYIESKNFKAETIAAMFSAKESVAKARGSGFTNLKFKDIEIFHDESGMPFARIADEFYSLSISHDGKFAITVATFNGNKLDIDSRMRKLYIKRPENGHKGTFGKAMIIAGSKGMTGSGYLASEACLKSGCGLVYHYLKDDEAFLISSIKHTEVIVKNTNPLLDLKDKDAVLFGPGVGVVREMRQMLFELLEQDINLIVDADGINILAENSSKLITKKAKVILTPHLGEFSRLTGELAIPGEKLYSFAKDFAKIYGIILALKDSKTYITDGTREEIIDRENSGLATAGSGDVLAGIITSFVAQGYEMYEAAVLGVLFHSFAGEVASKKHSKSSMLAGDIIEGLEDVFKEMEER